LEVPAAASICLNSALARTGPLLRLRKPQSRPWVPLAAGGTLPPVAAAAPHVGAGHLPPAAAGAALPAAVWLLQPLHVPADVPSGPAHKNTV
jgi:hypothetical protein